jgi:DNA-binding response OmpR family regulator
MHRDRHRCRSWRAVILSLLLAIPVPLAHTRTIVSKSVLVVDGDGSIRGMVDAVLRREGFEVEVARNEDAAVSRMKAKRYDALVVDMPAGDSDASQVLRAIAAERPDVKCVVIISSSSPANIETIDVANVAVKLRKPFEIRELIEAVRVCVQGD